MHGLDMPLRYSIWMLGILAGGVGLGFEFKGEDRSSRRYAEAVTRLADGVLMDTTRAYLNAMPVIQGGGSPESVEALRRRVDTGKARAKTFASVRVPKALRAPADELKAAVADLVAELEGMGSSGASVVRQTIEGRDPLLEQRAASVLLAHGAAVKRYAAARARVAVALTEMGISLSELPGSTRAGPPLAERREA